MSHTFEGGCHCGAVRYRVEVDELVAYDCNCSICRMKGFLHVMVPSSAFTLLSDQAALQTYTFNTRQAKHHFCSTCGIHSFYVPRSHPNGFDVNVRCLDGDAHEKFEVRAFDGQEWEANIATIAEGTEGTEGTGGEA